jgi:hypothetical protein
MSVPFPFRQIETGLLAFVSDIEKKLQEIIPDIPVFVLQSGDASYLLNNKFIHNDNSELYEKIPRFVLKFESFETQQDTKTNIFNKWQYIYKNDNYVTEFRRNQINFNVIGTIVSSNYIDALKHAEIFFSLISRENPFTYEYLGSTFESAFSSDDPDPFEMPEMDAANRNFIQSKNIILQLHIYTPNVKSIKKILPVEIGTIININNQTITTGNKSQYNFLVEDMDDISLEDMDDKLQLNFSMEDKKDQINIDDNKTRININYPYYKPQ